MFLRIATACILLITLVSWKADDIRLAVSVRMHDLSRTWAEAFMNSSPDISIGIRPCSDDIGIAALIDGTVDACVTMRPMRAEERRLLKERYFTTGREAVVASDAIGIFVHRDNPVRSLSIDTIRDIFSGRIINWNEVGGNDERILLYGAHVLPEDPFYFRDSILRDRTLSDALIPLADDRAVAAAVASTPQAVGFGSIAAVGQTDAVAVAVRPVSGGAPVAPASAGRINGSYPLMQPVYLYTRTGSDDILTSFVRWTGSPEGRSAVTNNGYCAVK